MNGETTAHAGVTTNVSLETITDALTDVDLTLWEVELPAKACEDPAHTDPAYDLHRFHADGDEHYVRFHTPCGCINKIAVVCMRFLKAMRAEKYLICNRCGDHFHPAQGITDLGEAN